MQSTKSKNHFTVANRLQFESLEDRKLLAVVTSLADAGAGTLRDAIATGDPVITFDVSGTIGLESTLEITEPVDIDATGQAIVIDAQANGEAFSILSNVFPLPKVALRNMSITGGTNSGIINNMDLLVDDVILVGNRSDEAGGAIRNSGKVALVNSEVSGNEVQVENDMGFALGGGIYNNGKLEVISSTIINNRADFNLGLGNAYGGGIAHIANGQSYNGTVASMLIAESLIDSNESIGGSGGGIFSTGGNVDIIASEISGNFAGLDSTIHGQYPRAGDLGGGIGVLSEFRGDSSEVDLYIDDSSIRDNEVRTDAIGDVITTPSGGGIGVIGYGSVEVIDAVISGNRADGIVATTLSNPRIGRVIGNGGGKFLEGRSGVLFARIDPTTISSNFATADGGGVSVTAEGEATVSVQLDDVTLSNNDAGERGGGLYVANANSTETTAVRSCFPDSFSDANGREALTPRPGLFSEIQGIGFESVCDGTTGGLAFVDSLFIAETPFAVEDAYLRIAAKPLNDGAANDAISLFSSDWAGGDTARDFNMLEALVGADWTPTQFPNGATFDIPLSQEVLGDMVRNGRLDIFIEDNTSVDFAELFIESGVVINRSTIHTNTAGTNGGGVTVADSPIRFQNATVSGNEADMEGGGIWSSQTGSDATRLQFSTIAFNQTLNTVGPGGAGIRHSDGAFLMENSIASDNLTLNPDANVAQNDLSFATEVGLTRFSLIQDEDGNDASSDLTNITGESADLLPLGLNGNTTGRTLTHFPSVDSPVRGQADSGNPLFEDQRRFLRPGDGPTRDMGAIENDGIESGPGDFDLDGDWDSIASSERDEPDNPDATADIDRLTAEIASGEHNTDFDLTNDGLVDLSDLEMWLRLGGARNPEETGANPFLFGDYNLDGMVDVSDFMQWNKYKFGPGTWSQGDFNADGYVDTLDFNLWNRNKFRMSTVEVFSEDFDGSFASGLNGTQPDVSLFDDASWSATSAFRADGSVVGTESGSTAYLPFTPENDMYYSFSLTVNPESSGSNWIGIAFTESLVAGDLLGANPGPWMRQTADRLGEDVQTFLDSAAGTGDSVARGLDGDVTLTMILDTGPTPWTVEFYHEGANPDGSPNRQLIRGPVRVSQVDETVDINYIAIASGEETVTGAVKDLRLTVGPSPEFAVSGILNDEDAILPESTQPRWTPGMSELSEEQRTRLSRHIDAIWAATEMELRSSANTYRNSLPFYSQRKAVD